MSDTRLAASVKQLIDFLEPTGSDFWAQKLSEIGAGLGSGDTADKAAADLEALFGGMGSLNDLYFCEANGNLPAGENPKEFNEEFSRLMDRMFKELRLRQASFWTRLRWLWLEWRHREEPPPRIKKTFRRRGS